MSHFRSFLAFSGPFSGAFSVALAVVLPGALLLAGCHPIDQTDFRPKAAVSNLPPPPPPVPEPETRTALVTIDYVKDNPDFRTALTNVIKVVETRRPGVLYDIVATIATAAEAPAARVRAADAMTVVEAAGVIPARIQLGLRLIPGQKPPQVRVYLR